MVIVAHDGNIAEIYGVSAADYLREDDVDIHGYFQGPAASYTQVDETIDLFGLVANNRIVDFFLLLSVQDDQLFIETHDSAQFTPYLDLHYCL